jgi:hypothetical protein
MEHRRTQIIPIPGADFRLDRMVTTRLVGVLDRIRFELPNAHPSGEMDEVAWFIREYPRAYRYHLA